ncbi:hypothetical protein CBM2621_B140063 [Cupriavidus taiwanensis]|nr:hypothetical protein CBM2621_B140063 [Cupriavidus taiwanensis]
MVPSSACGTTSKRASSSVRHRRALVARARRRVLFLRHCMEAAKQRLPLFDSISNYFYIIETVAFIKRRHRDRAREANGDSGHAGCIMGRPIDVPALSNGALCTWDSRWPTHAWFPVHGHREGKNRRLPDAPQGNGHHPLPGAIRAGRRLRLLGPGSALDRQRPAPGA